ncbi:HEAT repeat domain-containing protein [Streptomyces sp. NPDC001110]|uniref:HEAT repeat domain-containing protein n=1 Tax=Streptomyces sp. PAMC 26508 TaxID=1265601 RepID=UPI00059F87C2|nr:HEAT repeat domain-containing protein [Streptomyces sp. PAMC 26508]
MDSTVTQWVGELDADSSEVASDAQHALIAMGPEVLDELIAAAPHLGAFGQLCAIEVFTALKDPRPGEVLIGLLESENATVRQWAAEALADLEIQGAVPALQRAYEAFRQRGEAPDDSEGVALRWALTDLGARGVVIPPRAAALRASLDNLDPAWPTVHLAEVIEDLAAHDQAVLCFQVWRIKQDNGAFGGHGPGIDWDIDRQLSWAQIVADCRDWALLAAEMTDKAPDLVATICWIDASDL